MKILSLDVSQIDQLHLMDLFQKIFGTILSTLSQALDKSLKE